MIVSIETAPTWRGVKIQLQHRQRTGGGWPPRAVGLPMPGPKVQKSSIANLPSMAGSGSAGFRVRSGTVPATAALSCCEAGCSLKQQHGQGAELLGRELRSCAQERRGPAVVVRLRFCAVLGWAVHLLVVTRESCGEKSRPVPCARFYCTRLRVDGRGRR